VVEDDLALRGVAPDDDAPPSRKNFRPVSVPTRPSKCGLSFLP
jgi:hypothetical protein